jgi:hypothetical protein
VAERLPALKKYIDDGVVKCFCDNGVIKDLSEEQIEKIKEVEKFKLKVVAVIDQLAYFPGEETQMQCYLYINSNLNPWIIDDWSVGFMARVVNKGWGIEEDGSVGVIEKDGWLGRTM